MAMKNIADPYADYTVERLYEFLRTYELPREPGSKWEYSNLGFGLLGHVLARRAGNDYETMVRLRVAGPLDMTNTWIGVPTQVAEQLAKGHSMQLLPVGNWKFTDAMAGAGAFRSDIGDMMEFLAAALGHKRTGLAPAMAAMLRTRPATGIPGFAQLLGWNAAIHGDREIVWKDGATLGFSGFIGFEVKRRAGVVVLSSNAGGTAIETGMQLLRGEH
jgi:CubicO group peptidase (beta-lactamase class C family)